MKKTIEINIEDVVERTYNILVETLKKNATPAFAKVFLQDENSKKMKATIQKSIEDADYEDISKTFTRTLAETIADGIFQLILQELEK